MSDSNKQAAGQPVPEGPAVRPRQVRPRPRLWMLRLMALVLGLAPFVLLEVGLRLAGVGRDLSLVIPCKNAPGWFQLNPAFDEPFFGGVDLSGPHPQPFQLPKPQNVRRVVVVGGSTVVGFPYASELAFPRMLQETLQAQAGHEKRIEVLNAGITALNSTAEVATVQEAIQAEPDLIVVYTGHNEFYGPGGVASTAGGINPYWYRAILAWRRLYMVQLARRWMTRRSAQKDLIEALPANLHIPLNGKMFKAAVDRFHRNLDEMVKAATDADVKLLFVSPVANEHDQPPIENPGSDNDPEAKAWQARVQAAVHQAQWGDLQQGLIELEKLRDENKNDAAVRFRLAQAYEKGGQFGDAIEQFHAALEYDGCRFRAPQAFRQAMESCSKERCEYLDLHLLMSIDSEQSVPGRKFFLEHVHFTWEGNRFVSEVLARAIWEQIWKRDWSPERIPDASSVNDRMAVLDEDHLAALTLAMMIYQKPPFQSGIDAEALAKDLRFDSVKLFRTLPADRQALFEKLNPQQMSTDLLSELLNASSRANNDTLTGQFLHAMAIRQPWRCEDTKRYGEWLRSHGRESELKDLVQSIKAWPCPAR